MSTNFSPTRNTWRAFLFTFFKRFFAPLLDVLAQSRGKPRLYTSPCNP
jgi:hypothetical protein